MSEQNPHTFRKSLNLIDSSAIVIGSMIGSGIFIVSADMARTLGSPGWLLVAWLITGFMTVMGALSFGELATMMPKAGGTYVYLREAYNPLVGISLRMDTFPGNTDRHYSCGGNGVRQILRGDNTMDQREQYSVQGRTR